MVSSTAPRFGPEMPAGARHGLHQQVADLGRTAGPAPRAFRAAQIGRERDAVENRRHRRKSYGVAAARAAASPHVPSRRRSSVPRTRRGGSSGTRRRPATRPAASPARARPRRRGPGGRIAGHVADRPRPQREHGRIDARPRPARGGSSTTTSGRSPARPATRRRVDPAATHLGPGQVAAGSGAASATACAVGLDADHPPGRPDRVGQQPR